MYLRANLLERRECCNATSIAPASDIFSNRLADGVPRLRHIWWERNESLCSARLSVGGAWLGRCITRNHYMIMPCQCDAWAHEQHSQAIPRHVMVGGAWLRRHHRATHTHIAWGILIEIETYIYIYVYRCKWQRNKDCFRLGICAVKSCPATYKTSCWVNWSYTSFKITYACMIVSQIALRVRQVYASYSKLRMHTLFVWSYVPTNELRAGCIFMSIVPVNVYCVCTYVYMYYVYCLLIAIHIYMYIYIYI